MPKEYTVYRKEPLTMLFLFLPRAQALLICTQAEGGRSSNRTGMEHLEEL